MNLKALVLIGFQTFPAHAQESVFEFPIRSYVEVEGQETPEVLGAMITLLNAVQKTRSVPIASITATDVPNFIFLSGREFLSGQAINPHVVGNLLKRDLIAQNVAEVIQELRIGADDCFVANISYEGASRRVLVVHSDDSQIEGDVEGCFVLGLELTENSGTTLEADTDWQHALINYLSETIRD